MTVLAGHSQSLIQAHAFNNQVAFGQHSPNDLPSLVITFPGKDILAVTNYGMLLSIYCLSFQG